MSIIFYHVFLWAYRLGIGLIAPWNKKAKSWLEGRKGLFDRMAAELGADSSQLAAEKYPVIWMHCASLGEFEQGRPVLERLRATSPESKVVISFFSPSGYKARKDYKGADHIFYLPLDSRQHARRFIDLVKPTLVIWIKYDYWYYFLVELRKRKIPTLLVSGIFRADQPFFKWWGRLHRYMLECFTHLFVQTEASRKLLATIGFTGNVSVSGDTRFDRVIEIAESRESLPAIEAFCGDATVVVAGSTWEEDEEELDHYANTHPDIRFVIAPHEIEEGRLKEVEQLFRNKIRYSELAASRGTGEAASQGFKGLRPGQPAPNVLIIDNIGMLSRLYQYATVAYVGGGFGDDGVHNVLEAAVYGRPVVFGPVIEKYIEAVELTELGGGIVIDSALEAESVFHRLLNNEEEYRQACEASRDYVYGKKGATDRIVRYIQENRLLTS
ncbi:glycosyltransferase N-terminal domain-containing protein [Flavitalea sp. BT771]|uniref:3-deoxy-D-manno-octulosonic acid transferase n=1 Tax=Flavitalea sp. BT771 TaxID=3063329 RepID=UPI0026E2D86B|nr:glycosyltransferase N-terminal domain-containing protein [Flavitalea sp. BT771]MDO6429240.1 glycosyltransferase N-terminal domain-containing protein [Flavitalea sp. BT771]MDV6218632.1 glycosyltransferase N-terminal domain-containing protein [Flavitalea sp. BT771]